MVCGRRRHLDAGHRLLQSVDPVNIEALWRLFSRGLAFVAASAECLGVALDDHGLKLGYFLLSLGIRYIG